MAGMTKNTTFPEEDKLTGLEIRIAHQDLQIQDLSDMVNRQWQEIDRLRLLLKKAEGRLDSLEEDGPGGRPLYEKPPHY